MEPKNAVLEMIRILEDHPNIQMIEYDSKEIGMHVKIECIPPREKPKELEEKI